MVRRDKVFQSILRLISDKEENGLKKYLDNLRKRIPVTETQEKFPQEKESVIKEARRIIPQRKFKGLIGFDDLSSGEIAGFKQLSGENPWWISPNWLNETLFLCDGKRTLFQIAQILSSERITKIDLKELISYFLFLKKKGKVQW